MKIYGWKVPFVLEYAQILSVEKVYFPFSAYLLKQISQQLTALSKALSSNSTFIPLMPLPKYSPSQSIILANSSWLLGLMLSLISAIAATLMQRWAHRYLQLPQIPSIQRDPCHKIEPADMEGQAQTFEQNQAVECVKWVQWGNQSGTLVKVRELGCQCVLHVLKYIEKHL